MELKRKKDLYSEIENILNLVLTYDELSINLKDKNFMKSVSILLENFSLLEDTIKPKKPLLDDFQKKLSSLNQSVKITKKKLDDENEIIDNMNFIKIFVKNLTDKELEDFANQPKEENVEVKKEEIHAKDTNPNNYNYGNYDDYKKSIINQMIQKRLGEDLIKGNYYFFDSKPKIIPILRYVIGIMIIFASLIFLAEILLGSFTSIKIKITNNGVDTIRDINIISSTPFYIILMIMMIFTFMYLGYKYLIPIKNDNMKYNINNLPLGLGIFMGVILLGSDINELINLPEIISATTALGTSPENIALLQAYQWVSLSLSIFLLLFSIPMMINFILKPKRDLELTKELTEKYRKEINEKGILK